MASIIARTSKCGKTTYFARIRRSKESRGIGRFLTDDELKKVIEHCEANPLGPISVSVMLALTTGMRRGEIRNLTYQEIDFKSATIILSETKNGEPRRVPVCEPAWSMLKNFCKVRSLDLPWVFLGPMRQKTRSPFHVACWAGPDGLACVNHLLDAGARIDAANEDGLTPLMLACQGSAKYDHHAKNADGLIRRLVDAGASLNEAFRTTGKSAAFMCINYYDGLVSRSALSALVELGADVNAIATYSPEHRVSLLSGVAWVDSEAAKQLIAQGASVNPPTSPDCAPLAYAVRRGDPDLVKFLLEHGADRSIVLRNQQTLVDFAEAQISQYSTMKGTYDEIIGLLTS